MTSIKNVYNTISRKVDPINAYVHEARSSYLDTIREESEQRRTRFYKSNLASIYAQSGYQQQSVQNSTILDPITVQDDRGSVKSDQVYSSEQLAMVAAGNRNSTHLIKSNRPIAPISNLPLLPKVREDAMMGRTNSLPDNVLMQEEKMRQQ